MVRFGMTRVTGRSLEGHWKVTGRSLEGHWKVTGRSHLLLESLLQGGGCSSLRKVTHTHAPHAQLAHTHSFLTRTRAHGLWPLAYTHTQNILFCIELSATGAYKTHRGGMFHTYTWLHAGARGVGGVRLSPEGRRKVAAMILQLQGSGGTCACGPRGASEEG
jgi:hypothetical protein